MNAIALILSRLPDAKQKGKGWTARCPAHEDGNPSLSIAQGDDGTILIHCHAGCTAAAICSAAGIQLRDLFPSVDGKPNAGQRRRIVYTYDYRDEQGKVLYEVLRYAPKDFRQRRPDGNGDWKWKLDGVRRVLFRLPELLAADPAEWVFVAEGEKDVENLRDHDLVATTNVGGAGKWRDEYSQFLRGRRVCILPDNDDPGRQHARQVIASLRGVGQEVRIVELPGLPPKGDVSDWLVGGGTAEKLLELVEAASVLTPIETMTSDSDAEHINSLARAREALGNLDELAAKGADAVLQNAVIDALAVLFVQAATEYAAAKEKIRGVVNLDDLQRAVKKKVREHQSEAAADSESENGVYRETAGGIIYMKPTGNGLVPVPLTNFIARIVCDTSHDDGVEVRRFFDVEASLCGLATTFSVPAERFVVMNWPVEHLGARAILFPGLATKDHARCAIQTLSGAVQQRVVYAHTGWRQVGGQWVYLHAGGAIGRVGRVFGIEVCLPEALSLFLLPDPPAGDELVNAIRAAMQLLDLAPFPVTVPIYAACWRVVLGPCDLSVHLSGKTGVGKSELAALAQQHWGAGLNARHLPGSWSSTGNSLEGLGFVAKDAILVVDDFAPGGAHHDVQRQHREADRLLRAQGNRSGRLRMRADATLRPAKCPRGVILSTGEDVPRGQSLRSRMLIVELSDDELDWVKLSSAQRDAAAGICAKVLASFLQWLAGRYEQVQERLHQEVVELRIQATKSDMHRRTPDIVANLGIGVRYFIQFAQMAGALNENEAGALWTKCWSALGDVAAAQAKHQAAAEPTRRFIELLTAAIASGRAHVASPEGSNPNVAPEAWGWRETAVGTGDYMRNEWRPQGQRIGWLEGADLYLEPQASYAVVQMLGRDSGEVLAVSLATLKRRLREKGLLKTTDLNREVLTVRQTLEGQRREVLHLRADVVEQDGA